MSSREQMREHNFWHLVDYLTDEITCNNPKLKGTNIQDLIILNKVDIFDTLEGLADKIAKKKTKYLVTICPQWRGTSTNYKTKIVELDSSLTGENFVLQLNLEIKKEFQINDSFAILLLKKLP